MARGISPSSSCYNPCMSNVEQPLHAEENFEIEVSDLPAMTEPSDRQFSWLAWKMLVWQRYRHRRLISILFMATLAVIAFAVMLASINMHGSLVTPSVLPSQHSSNAQVSEFETLAQSPDRVYGGHSGAITGVAWSPDGKRLAAGGYDATVRIWDGRSGNVLLVYSKHTNAVLDIAWSPDGTRIASVSQDGTAQVWLASSGKRLFLYRNPAGAISSVTWSPDGTRIAFGTVSGTVQVWNVVTGKHLLSFPGHATGVRSLAWS